VTSSACAAPTCRVSLPRGTRRRRDVGASRGAARRGPGGCLAAPVWLARAGDARAR
jgi:hypothetical protein